MGITLDKVTKYYGKQKALDNISFTLQESEICGFLGPNGAGKSTTMKILTGYITDYQGKAIVGGADLWQQPLQAKQRLGYLPEHNPLYPDMYIQEYLLYVARLYQVACPREKVEHILQLTGLLPEIRKKIGQLSKGYRQRVGIAQALVHDPEVLILDEPMTGLDPNQLEEIRHLILQIGKNKTVLLSTHVMQEVEAICDRVIIIHQGKIVTDKSIQEIRTFSENQKGFLVRFAPQSNTDWLSASSLYPAATRVSADSWQFIYPAGQDLRIQLFYEAAHHQCPIIELREEEHHLEDVFRKLTHTK